MSTREHAIGRADDVDASGGAAAAIDSFVLIVGAMKCGTTSLFEYLAQHPQIAPCREKEPNFFTDDRNWARGMDWYRGLWDYEPGVHTRALEASTHYTKIPRFPNAAERIATVKADFRFIYVMRHPLQRIESHYFHGLASGWATTRNPLAQGPDPQVLAVTSYARQIGEYYRRFPKERILLLLFEDLKDEPQQVLSKVVRFLGLDGNVVLREAGKVYNARNARRKPRGALRLLKRMPVWGRMARVMPGPLRVLLRDVATTRVPDARGRLEDRQRDEVLALLRDDLRKLRDDYGVDISRWDLDI